MSENNENKEEKEERGTLKIKIDRSGEIEDLREKLAKAEDRANSAESTLSVIAQSDFDTKRQDLAGYLGIDPNSITVENIKEYQEIGRAKAQREEIENSDKAPKGGETATLNENQLTGKTGTTQKSSEDFSKANELVRKYSPRPLALSVWHTQQEMFQELSDRAKRGDLEAQKALDDMLFKQLNSPKRESIDLEFDSRVIRNKEKIKEKDKNETS